MRSVSIVILPPGLHDPARIAESQEPVFVETFVAESAIETLTRAVLHGLSRIDETQVHVMLVCPLIQCLAGQFGAVVEHNAGWGCLAFGDEPIQHPTHPLAGEARIDFDGQGFAAGQPRTFTAAWSNGGAAPGNYTVKLGIFSVAWGQNYAWNDNAATITVTSPDLAPG